MSRSQRLVLLTVLVSMLAVGIVFALANRDHGWSSEARFSGTDTAGQSVSPDGRWDLQLVWVGESDSGEPRVQLHLTDTEAARHFTRTITISDPEVDAVNDQGDPRVHWTDDEYGTVAAGTVRIGSEIVKLPE